MLLHTCMSIHTPVVADGSVQLALLQQHTNKSADAGLEPVNLIRQSQDSHSAKLAGAIVTC